MFRDVTDQLGNLDFFLDLALEATPDDFPLSGFEAISDTWDGTNVVSHGEKNQLFVDEIGERNLSQTMVQEGTRLEQSVSTRLCIYAGIVHALKFRNHSFRSSAFFLLNASSRSSLSPCWVAEKGIMCLSMLLKYPWASSCVLVPKPYPTCSREAVRNSRINHTDLVVLGFPFSSIGCRFQPLLVLGNGKEISHLLPFSYLG